MAKSSTKQMALVLLSLALTTIVTAQDTLSFESASSSDSPLSLVVGTYSLPLTVVGSTSFPSGLSLSWNDTNFVAENGFVLTEGASSASDNLGCAGTVTAGLYAVNFSANNDSNWTGPGVLWVSVSSTPVTLDITPSFSLNNGSSASTSFDLSAYAPYSDVTITAAANDTNFDISPSSITFTPNSTNGSFVYSTNSNTVANSYTQVTFTISGTNAASYALNQSTISLNVVQASNNTVLTSSSSDLTVVAGTYSLPVTLSITGANFADYVWVTTSTSGFAFNPTLVSNTSVQSISSYIGSVGTNSAGSYSLAFISNDSSYPAPADLTVTVSTTAIDLPVGSAINVSYDEGASNSSDAIVFDLSAYAPWSDITITPTVSDSNWIVNPVSISLTPAVTSASFVLQTATTATGNFSSTISYTISGTNNASYTISGTQTVNAISVGVYSGSSSDSNTTNTSSSDSSGSTSSNSTSSLNSTSAVASASAVLMVSMMAAIVFLMMILI